MSSGASSKLLIIDANVLIDFLKTERSILTIVCARLGSLHVPRSLLREVAPHDLDLRACEALGITVVEETLVQLDESVRSKPSPALSDTDALCLILARDFGWTCVTNDKALRKCCSEAQVPVLWGLELLGQLVEIEALTAADAVDLAKRIAETNPYITDKLVQRFTESLRGRRRRR